jgi:hypothetical protein
VSNCRTFWNAARFPTIDAFARYRGDSAISSEYRSASRDHRGRRRRHDRGRAADRDQTLRLMRAWPRPVRNFVTRAVLRVGERHRHVLVWMFAQSSKISIEAARTRTPSRC